MEPRRHAQIGLLAAAFAVLAAASWGAGCSARAPRAAVPSPAATATGAPSPEPADASATPVPVPKGLARGEPVLEKIAWAGERVAGALLAVAPLGPGEALAVGEPGVVHIAGSRVAVAPLPDGIPAAVWADGAAFAVVVGYGGIAWVREGAGGWTKVPTGTDADLVAVWGSVHDGAREVFAGGSAGTILRLAGDTWERVPAPANVRIAAFAGNASQVWALGDAGGGAPGDGAILRYDGTSFVDACPQLACGSAVYGGWAPVPGELWTVGARGEVVRYSGGQAEWITAGVREDLTGIWGTGTEDLFVVGNAGTLLQRAASGWTAVPAGESDVRAIAGLPSGEAWIVSSDSAIRHLLPAPPPGSGG